MTGGSIPASIPRASTAVRSVRCAPPGRLTFRSSRRPPRRRLLASARALRCQPETAPFSSAWIGSRTTVERALRLIVEEGALDQEGATVTGHGLVQWRDWLFALIYLAAFEGIIMQLIGFRLMASTTSPYRFAPEEMRRFNREQHLRRIGITPHPLKSEGVPTGSG